MKAAGKLRVSDKLSQTRAKKRSGPGIGVIPRDSKRASIDATRAGSAWQSALCAVRRFAKYCSRNEPNSSYRVNLHKVPYLFRVQGHGCRFVDTHQVTCCGVESYK